MAIDPNDTEALLAEARKKLHDLRAGKAVIEVDAGDYRTRFAPATVENLQAYVDELELRLAGRPVRGAVGFVF